MTHVYRIKPGSIDELKSIVNNLAQCMDGALIQKVCGSARKRFIKMGKAFSGHFEHLLLDVKLLNK